MPPEEGRPKRLPSVVVPHMRRGEHWYLIRWIQANGEIHEARARGMAELHAYIHEIEYAGHEFLVAVSSLEFAIEP